VTSHLISTALVVGVLTAVGCPVPPAAAATPAASPYYCSGSVEQDFDDDGHADLVVRRSAPATLPGVVDIVMSGGTTQVVSAASLGFPAVAGDRFGAAVTIVNLDTEDNCPDLVVGAPGVGDGVVYLVRGNGSGVAAAGERVAAPVPAAGFGESVASVGYSGEAYLLAGLPGYDVPGAVDAGAVLVWPIAGGLPGGVPTVLDYTDFGAAPASGDRLGSVLAVSGYDVLLGVPYRDVGGATDAGEVITFDLAAGAVPPRPRAWTRANQDSAGAPNSAEAGDHFGAAVDAEGALVVVGVPGEDVAGYSGAGLAMRYAVSADNTPTDWVAWHQGSKGIPGGNEAGDRFGAAVHLGWVEVEVDGDPFGMPVYAVGAPGEDLAGAKNAGTVTVIAPDVKPAHLLSQGSGLPGAAERGDQVGAALGDLPGEYTGTFHGGTGLVVGVPGEDVGAVVDAGVAVSTRGLLPKGHHPWQSTSSVGGPVAGGRFGQVLPFVP
jgi:hypothetical protein